MRHLLSVDDLSDSEIRKLCEKALQKKSAPSAQGPSPKAVGLLFLEPSTRTRVSFERAAQKLGVPTVFMQAMGSSLEKGESIDDTLDNLAALDIGTFVIRFSENVEVESLRHFSKASIINAGDGVREHPSQALLDLATLLEHVGGDWKKLENFKLAILGDLRRSRVAGSWAKLAPRFGIQLQLVSPTAWRPRTWGQELAWSDKPRESLPGAQAVMALRVQKERMTEIQALELEDFISWFQLGPQDLRQDQALLHPGPVNWGVELHESFRADPRSLILKQVNNGLHLRAGLLEFFNPLGRDS